MNEYLTPKQRQELLSAHELERESRYSDRIKAILMLDKGFSYEEVGEILLTDSRSVRRWEERYFSGGIEALLSDGRGGSSGKLSQAQRKLLDGKLSKKIFRTAFEISKFIKAEFGMSYSISGIHYLMEELGFSYKKPKVSPNKGNTVKQVEFVENLEDIMEEKGDFDKLYFMDGIHPQFETSTAYGWIKRGQEVELPAQSGRQRLNIVGALDAETNEVVAADNNTLNGEFLVKFLAKLEKKNPLAENIFVVLDNAGYHRNTLVNEFVANSKIKLLYLPPYSPNINLIERFWGFLKREAIHNHLFDNFKDFREKILEFIKHAHRNFPAKLNSLLEWNFQYFESSTT